MALVFISIGLSDERDMSIRALGAARSCDKLFIELHTSRLNTDKGKLGQFIGKDITVLSRQDLEENHQKILNEARSKSIGLLIGGDAFVSTSHVPLMTEAKKQGIEVKVIHGSSISSAVCEAGLHLQKFGQAITIPFPDRTKGKVPVSVYDVVLENRKRGLHTLCLLDMIAEEGRFMKVGEALSILMDLEKKTKKRAMNRRTEVAVFSRIGSDSQKIVYGEAEMLAKLDFGEPLHCIAVLGKLHFSEKECLENLRLTDDG